MVDIGTEHQTSLTMPISGTSIQLTQQKKKFAVRITTNMAAARQHLNRANPCNSGMAHWFLAMGANISGV